MTVENAWWFSWLVMIVLAEPLIALLAVAIIIWNSNRNNIWALLLAAVFLSIFISRSGEHVRRVTDKRGDYIWTPEYAKVYFITRLPEPIAIGAFCAAMIFRKKKLLLPPPSMDQSGSEIGKMPV